MDPSLWPVGASGKLEQRVEVLDWGLPAEGGEPAAGGENAPGTTAEGMEGAGTRKQGSVDEAACADESNTAVTQRRSGCCGIALDVGQETDCGGRCGGGGVGTTALGIDAAALLPAALLPAAPCEPTAAGSEGPWDDEGSEDTAAAAAAAGLALDCSGLLGFGGLSLSALRTLVE
jgi:hypothetical protein